MGKKHVIDMEAERLSLIFHVISARVNGVSYTYYVKTDGLIEERAENGQSVFRKVKEIPARILRNYYRHLLEKVKKP